MDTIFVQRDRELRDIVANKIGRPAIPDVVWNHCDVSECREYAVSAYDPQSKWSRAKDEIDELISAIAREMAVYGGETHPHPGRSITRKWNGRFTKKEHLRALALNEYYARHAMESGEVELFRYKVRSGGKLPPRSMEDMQPTMRLSKPLLSERAYISPEEYAPFTEAEAKSLLRSHAMRYMSFEQFREWNIPLLNHRSFVCPTGSDMRQILPEHNGQWVWLAFDSPRQESFVLRAPVMIIDGFKLNDQVTAPAYPARLDVANSTEERVFAATIMGQDHDLWDELTDEQKERWAVVQKRLDEREALLPTRRTVHSTFGNELAYPQAVSQSGEEGWVFREERVWPGSVLDDLRFLSESFARSYHWDPALATWFVLTSEIPRFNALDVNTYSKGGGDFTDACVELTVLPWVSVETLSELYKQIQKNFFGGDNQPIHARNLELFRFVENQRKNDGKLPTWRSMMKQWNNQHPADWDKTSPKQRWEYEDPRIMHRDYTRARQKLLHYDYTAVSLAKQIGETE